MNARKDSLTGAVQTVLGRIMPEQMGITLSHEHCLIDFTCMFTMPEEATGRKWAYERLSIHNAGYIRYHHLNNLDNLLMGDEEESIKELSSFKRTGGGSIADMTGPDLGRDPSALQRISRATGLNIIMGSGNYVKIAQRQEIMEKRSEEEIAGGIIRDIFEGVKDTGICSGLIGEIGCSWPLEDCERKSLRAAALAQRETGAPLVVHPGRNEDAPKEIVKILKEMGADLTHTSMSHTDRTVFIPEKRYALLEEGCYLAYDEWGYEGYYPESLSITDILNDAQRIAHIKDLIAHGFGKQILIGHDICNRCRYATYGGHGYSHILVNALPPMRRRGVTEEQIKDLLIENPKRFFLFR